MKIKIKGFIQNSLLDWEGKIVSTLYTPYCNFKCPYCQNSGLVLNPDQYDTVSFETIADYLSEHRDWVDGVCLTGGEPCFFEDLPDFIKRIRHVGMQVKLDTNGTFPGMLRRVLDINIVDYVAMDIKAPLDFQAYSKSAGTKNGKLLEKVKESIKLIMKSGVDYEFRTTVVPTLHEKADIVKIAKHIEGASKYALQNFSNRETLDPEFEKIKPYDIEELKEMCERASSYVKVCLVRGK